MPEENGFATATLRIELWKTLDVNNYVKLNRSMRRSGCGMLLQNILRM